MKIEKGLYVYERINKESAISYLLHDRFNVYLELTGIHDNETFYPYKVDTRKVKTLSEFNRIVKEFKTIHHVKQIAYFRKYDNIELIKKVIY